MLQHQINHLKQLYRLDFLGHRFADEILHLHDQSTNALPSTHDQLCQTMSQCKLCTLSKTRTQVILPTGMSDAPLIAFVLASPGIMEDQTGQNMSEKHFELMDRILENVLGISRTQTYITCAIKCKVPSQTTDIGSHAAMCRPFLLKELESINPKLVMTLGAEALESLSAGQLSYADHAGHIVKFQNYSLLPTMTLGEIIRNPTQKKQVHQHFLSAKVFLQL